MLRTVLFFLLAAGTLAVRYSYPRISWLGEIEASELFNPADDPTDPYSPWKGPLDAPLQKPQSYRTHYIFWDSARFTATLFPGGNNYNKMDVRLSAAVGALTTFNFRLLPPYLEVDPHACAGDTGLTGNCRCNVVDNYVTVAGNNFVGNYAAGKNLTTVTFPDWTYFEHAPFPGQHPLMRTYRKICYQVTSGADTTYYLDTTVWLAVTHACDIGATTNFACGGANLELPALAYSWNRATLPDPLLDAAWRCNKVGFLGEFFDFTPTLGGATNPVTTNGIRVQAPDECWGETKEMRLARSARTTCCGARDSSTTGLFNGGLKYGTCYNPQVENCCGWKPYNPKYEKCCSKPYARINYAEQHCKCTSWGEFQDCQMPGQNQFLNSGDRRGETDSPVVTNRCCGQTKYPELLPMVRYGYCYSLNADAPIKCCDDGQIYDMGSKQCCPINGVQSLNIPCPCNRDTDCPTSGLNLDTTQKCCLQQWPKSWEDGQGPNAMGYGKNQCDKYANYPDGISPAEIQRCHGSCFDTRFQTCCNGQLCVREFERCCNSTCCNRFTSGCMEGTRPGAWGFGGRINPNDYLVDYEMCTSVEVFTTRRAFWVWVMPVFWLAATVASLAIVIVVARRATENHFDLNEKAMVFFSVFLIALNCCHYFSPTFKYGIVACFVSLIVIIGAVMRSRALSLLVVFLMFGLIIYWIDPYEGNIYLSLTGGVSHAVQITDANFLPVGYTSGIIEALFRIERNRTECTKFYDYFQLDPFVRDFERFVNPAKTTFGFCTRAWMSTLLIFSLVSMAMILVLFMLSVNSFAKKIVPQSSKEDLTFQVQPVNEFQQ